MLNEESIIKATLHSAVYNIQCAGISTQISPVRILSAAVVLVSLASNTHRIFFKFEVSIRGVTEMLLRIAFSMSMIAFLRFHSRICHNGERNIIYEQIAHIDAKMKLKMSKQKDLLLLSMLVIIILLAGFDLAQIYAFGYQLQNVIQLSIIPVSYELLSLAMMKRVIVKCLRYIRTAEEFMERVDDTVSITRLLLKCNRELNETTKQLATSFAMYTFQLILYYLYVIWVKYGVALSRPLLTNTLVSSASYFTATFSILFALALMSSLITNEVEETTLELNISMTARCCTERERKMISLFLLELHHTPTQLSALGLFDIHLPGLSTACAIMLSYLLVLIQFSELFTG